MMTTNRLKRSRDALARMFILYSRTPAPLGLTDKSHMIRFRDLEVFSGWQEKMCNTACTAVQQCSLLCTFGCTCIFYAWCVWMFSLCQRTQFFFLRLLGCCFPFFAAPSPSPPSPLLADYALHSRLPVSPIACSASCNSVLICSISCILIAQSRMHIDAHVRVRTRNNQRKELHAAQWKRADGKQKNQIRSLRDSQKSIAYF